MNEQIETLATALPKEILRVRKLVEQYESVPNGNIAAALMKMDIKQAEQADRAQDVIAMLRAHAALKSWSD